ncbi:hypothetical protein RRG08_035120 [Elysia crispata]|uniref:Uncharacterized protein n=1 Tax=Elysia crispata TaxID=231223 RepID=A0AAE1A8W2_9GAST|nr:hypothetical protein RRG08_035120 [Elysia crispata]
MKSEKSITKLAMENDQMLLSHSETGSLRVEAEDLRDGRTQGLPSAGITNNCHKSHVPQTLRERRFTFLLTVLLWTMCSVPM